MINQCFLQRCKHTDCSLPVVCLLCWRKRWRTQSQHPWGVQLCISSDLHSTLMSHWGKRHKNVMQAGCNMDHNLLIWAPLVLSQVVNTLLLHSLLEAKFLFSSRQNKYKQLSLWLSLFSHIGKEMSEKGQFVFLADLISQLVKCAGNLSHSSAACLALDVAWTVLDMRVFFCRYFGRTALWKKWNKKKTQTNKNNQPNKTPPSLWRCWWYSLVCGSLNDRWSPADGETT